MLYLQSVKYPKKSYVYVQDVLGKKFQNPLVQQYKQRCVEMRHLLRGNLALTNFRVHALSDQRVISP